MRALLGLALAAATTRGAAAAGRLDARGTAEVAGRGQVSVGVLGPLEVGIGRGLELRAHPLLFFAAPNLVLRARHLETAGWLLTGEYGLSVPTLAMRALQGYLFPSWERSDRRIGWLVVPRAGFVASRGARVADALSLGADVAVGVPLGRDDTPTLEAPAPLELLFAPVTTGWRARAGVVYDASLSERWRLRSGLDVYLFGAENASPLAFRASVAAEVAVGTRGRLVFGLTAWNSDQHGIDDDGGRVRSTDLLPMADFVWTL